MQRQAGERHASVGLVGVLEGAPRRQRCVCEAAGDVQVLLRRPEMRGAASAAAAPAGEIL